MHQFIISDTHFGHENIKIYEPIRQNYSDEKLVELWNSIVNPADEVLHLGDFAFRSFGWERISQLNGNITLLKGNHDFKKSNSALSALGFKRIIGSIELELTHKDLLLGKINQKFDKEIIKKCACLVKEINGKRILFSHYPPFYEDPYDKSIEVLNIKELLGYIYEISECEVNYHGHIHSKVCDDARCINVSIEHISFKPFLLG